MTGYAGARTALGSWRCTSTYTRIERRRTRSMNTFRTIMRRRCEVSAYRCAVQLHGDRHEQRRLDDEVECEVSEVQIACVRRARARAPRDELEERPAIVVSHGAAATSDARATTRSRRDGGLTRGSARASAARTRRPCAVDVVLVVVRQFETESRIAARPSQVVPLIHASPLACTAARTARVVVVVARSGTSTWFSTTSFRISQPGELRERVREAARARAAALDEVGDARPAERAERRVDGEAACAARELGRPVDLVASARRSAATRYSAVTPHRGAVGVGVRDEREAAVVRDVEPLVRVGRPRVGLARRRRRGGGARATRRPTARTRRRRAARRPARARSVGDLARSGRTRRCSRRRPARRRSSGRSIAASAVARARPRACGPASSAGDGDDRAAAEPEQPQRAVDRDVALRAGEHADRRRAGEAVALDVPADALEHARGARRRGR